MISRFGLKYHIEQREFQVDELTVGQRGHKLIENTDPPREPIDPSIPPTFEKDGKVVLPRPGMISMLRSSSTASTMSVLVAKAMPIDRLAMELTNRLGHPVVDKTGLAGKYDFSLEYSPELFTSMRTSPAANLDLGVELSTALQQQLGLRLVKAKGKVDVVVVDKIERTPTEN